MIDWIDWVIKYDVSPIAMMYLMNRWAYLNENNLLWVSKFSWDNLIILMQWLGKMLDKEHVSI